MNTQQYLYQGFTLIDITPTGVISYSPQNEHKRNQQRNWETVQQIISLRTQPTILETENFVADLKDYNFGINYVGQHRIWSFTFGVDYPDIYQEGYDKFGLVKYDFNITPIILGLDETVRPTVAVFEPKGPCNNIYFKTLLT